VTKLEVKDDRIELFLSRVTDDAYAKLKIMLGKGFESSYNLEAVLGIVSRALRMERFERLQAVKSEYLELKEKLATAQGRFKTAQGDARSQLQGARELQNALQALVKNRTDYDSLTQTASDPERDQYAREAADLEKTIKALDQETRMQRAEEIRKALTAEAEEAGQIKAQLNGKPGSLPEWQQQMTSLGRWEQILNRQQSLHRELEGLGQPVAAADAVVLQQGFEEIQTLRGALVGQRQALQLADLDTQYQVMDRARRQLTDAYTRAFGTPRQRPEGEKLFLHLHQMRQNREAAQQLGSDQALGQGAGLAKDMERLQRQIGPVQVPRSPAGASPVPMATPLPGVSAPSPATPSSSGASGRVRVAGKVMAAKLVSRNEPTYPPLAKTARIQGVVRMEVIIDTDGTVQDIKVVSGHPLLVKAAIEAVSGWRYQMTLLNNKAVEVQTEVDLEFSLAK